MLGCSTHLLCVRLATSCEVRHLLRDNGPVGAATHNAPVEHDVGRVEQHLLLPLTLPRLRCLLLLLLLLLILTILHRQRNTKNEV